MKKLKLLFSVLALLSAEAVLAADFVKLASDCGDSAYTVVREAIFETLPFAGIDDFRKQPGSTQRAMVLGGPLSLIYDIAGGIVGDPEFFPTVRASYQATRAGVREVVGERSACVEAARIIKKDH